MYDEIAMPRVKLLSLLVAASCAGLTAPAFAAPEITLTAVYALGGAPVTDGLTDADAQLNPSGTTFPSATGADYYLTKNDGSSGVFFHTYGFTGGSTYFGARASGEGADFYAKTGALYSGSFTNSGSSAVALNFGFNVDAGEVGLFGSGVGSANLRLQIRRNGVAVSTGDTTITQTAGGTSCSESDLGALGSWASCAAADSNFVEGFGGAYSVDMGLVAAGETITVEYDIISTVSGRYTGGAASSGDCNNTEQATAATAAMIAELPSTSCVYFNGIARSGDPFNGNGLGFATADFSLTAQELPEPGSLSLLAASGGGWWLSRRRRAGVATG